MDDNIKELKAAVGGKRYELGFVLMVTVMAKVRGADNRVEIAAWVQVRAEAIRALLGVAYQRMPCDNTYRRLLQSSVEGVGLAHLVGRFLSEVESDIVAEVVSLDGKTLRGSLGDYQKGQSACLSAYLPEVGITLMQVPIPAGTNEIGVMPTLLQPLPLQGKVVLADALHTQRTTSDQVVTAGADYIGRVKENQPYYSTLS